MNVSSVRRQGVRLVDLAPNVGRKLLGNSSAADIEKVTQTVSHQMGTEVGFRITSKPGEGFAKNLNKALSLNVITEEGRFTAPVRSALNKLNFTLQDYADLMFEKYGYYKDIISDICKRFAIG